MRVLIRPNPAVGGVVEPQGNEAALQVQRVAKPERARRQLPPVDDVATPLMHKLEAVRVKETSKNPVFRVFEIESYSQSYLISHRFVGANLIC